MQAALLGAYGRLADTGVLDNRITRRAFEVTYGAYKVVVEAGPIRHLRPHVRPGSLVVDVGANIGFFTVRLARWVGPGGRVLAIEPEAGHVETLRARLRRRGLEDRATIVHGAATDRPGRTRLVLNRRHPGDHKIGENGVEVEAVTIDDQVDREGPRHVSLVKIDVQGAEELVLEGATRTIERYRPALFVEVFQATLEEFGSSVSGLLQRMAALGYTGHVLGRSGVSGAVDPATLVARYTERYGDVLFLPTESSGSRPPLG